MFCRKLTEEQKSLILAFAETETGVGGTVNGVTDTTHGNVLLLLACLVLL